MTQELDLHEIQKEWHGSLTSYLVGFFCSLLFTALSFGLVIGGILSGHALVYVLIGLAVLQAGVQAVFFLHVGQESKPRWETITLCFTILVLFIIVVGSLWIMHDLNERMMPGM